MQTSLLSTMLLIKMCWSVFHNVFFEEYLKMSVLCCTIIVDTGFCFYFLQPYLWASRVIFKNLFIYRYNPSHLNGVFGIWLALNKYLLHEWLNSLWRVEGCNHYFFLSRLLFNHITEVDQGSTHQQVQRVPKQIIMGQLCKKKKKIKKERKEKKHTHNIIFNL